MKKWLIIMLTALMTLLSSLSALADTTQWV